MGFTSQSRIEGLKTWQWVLILILGSAVATIPGILLSPYSINPFDEPYQILNGMAWETSIYSPLSSWLANKFGMLTDWRYLSFRYLALALNYIGILVCSIYALIVSERKKLIALTGILSTLLGLTYKPVSAFYGWDSWTVCILPMDIVLCLSLINKFDWTRIILLAIGCGFTVLMRIPNISVFVFCLFILLYVGRNCKLLFPKIIVFILVFILTSSLILFLLYGNLQTYFSLFPLYHIGDHSFFATMKPVCTKFFGALAYSGIIYLAYICLKRARKKGRGTAMWVSFAVCVIFVLISAPRTTTVFGPIFCLGLLLVSLLMLLLPAIRKENRKLTGAVMILFLLSFSAGLGSNTGYAKALIWPLWPLIIWLFGFDFKSTLKNLFICSVISYGAYSVYAILHYSFNDKEFKYLTYRFRDPDSPLYGMYTNPEDGEFITHVYDDMKPYIAKGYSLMILKQGNEYLYEYVFKTPNMLQRHNFSHWYAFWDKDYVRSVQQRIIESRQPLVVLYRQWKDPDNTPLMFTMLEGNIECVVDKPGYSIWIKEPDEAPLDASL